jgi:hypothetical protein
MYFKLLMNLFRSIHILSIIMFFIGFTGCTTSQKVNLSVLEGCKNKTFKLGVVKAAVNCQTTPFGPDIEQKKKALARIPIEEICSTLNEQYALKIDTNVDRSPRVVEESFGSGETYPATPVSGGLHLSIHLRPTTENAYYGNLIYDNSSTFWLMLGGDTKTNNDEAVPDVVNVTYWMENQAFSFKTKLLYSIHMKSSGQDVLALTGIVESVPIQMGLFSEQKADSWDVYIEYAGHIKEALERDLTEAAKKNP